jgi:hypothetical protein
MVLAWDFCRHWYAIPLPIQNHQQWQLQARLGRLRKFDDQFFPVTFFDHAEQTIGKHHDEWGIPAQQTGRV